jgi:hypothetical protein
MIAFPIISAFFLENNKKFRAISFSRASNKIHNESGKCLRNEDRLSSLRALWLQPFVVPIIVEKALPREDGKTRRRK